MHLTISSRIRAGLLALAMMIVGVSATVVATPGSAAAAPLATKCTTLTLDPGTSLGFSITPRMTAPVCYNGISIWQNGPITPGANTVGYSVNGFSWFGSYNSGGNWIGIGENFTATAWGGWASFSCSPRWMISNRGNVFSYTRGC
jgi:hypothetical protein